MSRLPFELFLALRYLRPKRTFVSVITLISILGVALGVAVLIIVISVMSGFDHDLREKILGFNAHIQVFNSRRTMQNYAFPLSSRFYNLSANTAIQKQTGNLYTLEINDLPGIEEEPLMPAASALQARVEFYYRDQNEPSSETPDQYWKRIGKKWNEDVDHFVDKKKELAVEVSQDVS